MAAPLTADDLLDDVRPPVAELHLQLLVALFEVHQDHLHTRARVHHQGCDRCTGRRDTTAATAARLLLLLMSVLLGLCCFCFFAAPALTLS